MDAGTLLDGLAAYCRAALADDLPLVAAMVVAGLVGGAAHCAGMCGPFVLAQVVATGTAGRPFTEFRRLRSAALLPYHFGRATTYIVLGALGAAFTERIVALTALPWLAGGLMAVAALLFLMQALGRAPSGNGGGRWGRFLADRARPLLAGQSPGHRYGLGLLLGFLPCGLLYAALAAAAATGNAFAGGVAMAAFAAGTAPALIGVGYAGGFFARRWPDAARVFATALLIVNAGILGVIAWSQVV